MDSDGNVMEQPYNYAWSFLDRAGYAVLPFRMQPKGFDRKEFEHYLDKTNSYLMWEWPLWYKAIRQPNIEPSSGNTTLRSKGFIKRVEKLSVTGSIWVRPLVFGCSIKELILSFIIPSLVAWFTALLTAQNTIRGVLQH